MKTLGSPSLLGLALSLLAAGCVVPVEEIIYVERSGCLACHRPLRHDGTAVGIEQAHPPVDGRHFECIDCHGGDPEARNQSSAHVSPGVGGDTYIKNLAPGELDLVDEDYLRFVNPGDLRVAPRSCGSASGLAGDGGCHQDVIERVKLNNMATFSGELNVVRYRAGIQRTPSAEFGVYDVVDLDYVAGEAPATVGSLRKIEEPRVRGDEREIGPFQDLYLTKACMRCHLWSFGDNKFPGDFRSSGCSACHMVYSDDGLSKSADPMIDPGAPAHPVQHVLTPAVTTEQCMHCHYRGGRIGPSYMGYRESAGPGLNPANPTSLGKALHGHDADYYLVDEDDTNEVDETPPDVHFEAGMHCIDCHTEKDVHGDGHLYGDTVTAVEIRCEDCHGDAMEETNLHTSRGRPMTHMTRDEEGRVWLTGKVDGVRRQVPQVKQALERSPHPDSLIQQAMGTYESGYNHSEQLECYTCHSGWQPSCYGCHVTVDMSGSQRSLISGAVTPGRATGSRRWVTVDDLVLMVNTRGRISPSMPAEKMFFNAKNGAGELLIDKQVRSGQNGVPGMGHRAFPPHTVRRFGAFGACNRCHPTANFDNEGLIYQAYGLGSGRYVELDGNGKAWDLDRLLDSQSYEPTVLVGHPEPQDSRPLNRDEIDGMLNVTVP